MKKSTLLTSGPAITTLKVFPTLVHSRKNFLDADKLQEHVDTAQDKADVCDDAVKSAVLDFGLIALAAAHVDLERYESIELTEIWYNVLQVGDHHWDHTHANHVLSGAIYLTEGCFTIFSDPRPAASVS